VTFATIRESVRISASPTQRPLFRAVVLQCDWPFALYCGTVVPLCPGPLFGLFGAPGAVLGVVFRVPVAGGAVEGTVPGAVAPAPAPVPEAAPLAPAASAQEPDATVQIAASVKASIPIFFMLIIPKVASVLQQAAGRWRSAFKNLCGLGTTKGGSRVLRGQSGTSGLFSCFWW
jgi:hypothetical protein